MNPTPPPNAPTPPPAVRRRSLGLSRNLVERLILVVVLAGSFWAIWWSATRLHTLQTESRQLNQQVARLTADIDLMRAQWPASRTQEVARRFERIGEALFAGEPALTEWSDTVSRDSVPLALQSHVRLGSTVTTTNEAGPITRVQATLEVVPNPDVKASRSFYHRLVDWSRRLSQQPRRLDLVELNLAGTPASANSATVTVELWTEDKPITTAAAQAQATP